jgi:hypothetical protein
MTEWQEGLSEHIFTTNTSIISTEMIRTEMKNLIKADDWYVFDDEPVDQKEAREMKKLAKEEEKLRRKTLRSQELCVGQKSGQSTKRVIAEAIDLDWIFKEGNAKIFLKLLSEQDNNKLFVTKGIRVFIDIIWSKYQPKIVKQVFFPYILYTTLFIILCSKLTQNALDEIVADRVDGNIDESTAKYLTEIFLVVSISIVCGFIWFSFFFVEYLQVREDYKAYFADYWNLFDFMSLVLNAFYVIVLNLIVVTNNDFIPVSVLRLVGAFACWFLWIKVFYWMRLFRPTAMFITLIQQTVADIRWFSIMVGIILTSFGHFFMVIHLNN